MSESRFSFSFGPKLEDTLNDVIPSGAFYKTVTLTPKDDVFAESSETIFISLTNAPYYSAVPPIDIAVALSDNELVPPALSLRLASSTNGVFDLTLGSAATRLFNIEASSDFTEWHPFGPFGTLLTATNLTHLLDLMPTNAPYLFFRARQQDRADGGGGGIQLRFDGRSVC